MPKTIYYWDHFIDPLKLQNTLSKKELTRLDKALDQLLNGQYQSANLELKKNQSNYKIYGIRLNKASRLVFTTVHLKNHPVLLILDIIPENHKYEKSWVFKHKALPGFMKQRVSLETFEEVFTSEKLTEDKTETKAVPQLKAASYYNQQFIPLVAEQNQALNTKLPLLVRGPAGSGKSCIAFIRLQQLSKQIQDNFIENPRVLLVSKSQDLLNIFTDSWQATRLQQAQFDPEFRTLENIAAEILNYKKPFLSEKNFYDWCNKQNKNTHFYPLIEKNKQMNENKNLRKLYNECKIIANLPKAEYLKLGQLQSHFDSSEQREQMHQLYACYQQELLKQESIDLALYSPQQFSIQPHYDCIIVDESQDFSRAELLFLILLGKNQQLCFCMDSNQALWDNVSNSAFLKQELSKLQVVNLTTSHRCPKNIAKMANTAITLKNLICSGVSNKGEYYQYASQEDNNLGPGRTRILEDDKDINNFINNLTPSHQQAVITSEARLDEAKKIFGENTTFIFTPEGIKGLEYQRVIIYKLLDQPIFKTINQQLSSLGIHLDNADNLNPNLPKDKRQLFHLEQSILACHSLFVSITRAQLELILIQPLKKGHNLIQLMNALKGTQQQSLESSMLADKLGNDWQGWLDSLEKLLKQQAMPQVFNTLKLMKKLFPGKEPFICLIEKTIQLNEKDLDKIFALFHLAEPKIKTLKNQVIDPNQNAWQTYSKQYTIKINKQASQEISDRFKKFSYKLTEEMLKKQEENIEKYLLLVFDLLYQLEHSIAVFFYLPLPQAPEKVLFQYLLEMKDIRKHFINWLMKSFKEKLFTSKSNQNNPYLDKQKINAWLNHFDKTDLDKQPLAPVVIPRHR